MKHLPCIVIIVFNRYSVHIVKCNVVVSFVATFNNLNILTQT